MSLSNSFVRGVCLGLGLVVVGVASGTWASRPKITDGEKPLLGVIQGVGILLEELSFVNSMHRIVNEARNDPETMENPLVMNPYLTELNNLVTETLKEKGYVNVPWMIDLPALISRTAMQYLNENIITIFGKTLKKFVPNYLKIRTK